MIYLYSGTPGSGKSLHTAQVLYYQIAKGWPCICNFDFAYYRVKARHPGQFLYCANDSLTPGLLMGISEDYFRDHPFHEGRILLVIDECQLLFNAREWDVKGRKEWLSFFTQHRKFGYDIILVAQFDRMIDRQIRSLIEYEQVHRKVSNFGFWGKLFSAVSGGKLFVSVKIWYPMKEKVGSEFFKANKKYYRLYDTYSKFDNEKVAESPKNSTKAEFCCVGCLKGNRRRVRQRTHTGERLAAAMKRPRSLCGPLWFAVCPYYRYIDSYSLHGLQRL